MDNGKISYWHGYIGHKRWWTDTTLFTNEQGSDEEYWLTLFILEVRKRNGMEYPPSTMKWLRGLGFESLRKQAEPLT